MEKEMDILDILIEEHQHMASEIDKLAEFILTKIDGEPSDNESAVDTAIRLLRKQVPIRPRLDDNGLSCEYYEAWIECPVCSEPIPEYTVENETSCHCIGCGQKLEWGDEKWISLN